MELQMDKKPRKWAVDYITKSGEKLSRKYLYVRAADVFEALDLATHRLQFDMIMASSITPDTNAFEEYEIMSIGTV